MHRRDDSFDVSDSAKPCVACDDIGVPPPSALRRWRLPYHALKFTLRGQQLLEKCYLPSKSGGQKRAVYRSGISASRLGADSATQGRGNYISMTLLRMLESGHADAPLAAARLLDISAWSEESGSDNTPRALMISIKKCAAVKSS